LLNKIELLILLLFENIEREVFACNQSWLLHVSYAALQTVNEPSGSINRLPNGSIKARYGILSCTYMYVHHQRAKSWFRFTMQRLRKLLKCLHPPTYVNALRLRNTAVSVAYRCIYIHRWLAKHRWKQGR